MAGPDEPQEPRPWRDVARSLRWYARPVYGVSWLIAWFAHEVSRSPFLALAKLLAAFALPLGAITYWLEAKDRHRDRVYRTWEVVMKAESAGGSPARYEALQDLVEYGAVLAKVDLHESWLEAIDLRGADLRFANLSGAHLAEARLGCRRLRLVKRRCSNLRWANLAGADLAWADLSRTNLSRATVVGVDFTCASLMGAELVGIRGWEGATWRHADLRGARHIPAGLLAHARGDSASTDEAQTSRKVCLDGRPEIAPETDTLELETPGT
jgi:hypothetical protein